MTRSHPLRWCIEFLAGFIAVLIVLGALLIWRLSMAPVSSAFLTPYVEKGIVDLVPGTQVSIVHSLLTWDNVDRSITLHADGIHLTGEQKAPIADIAALDIRVSVLGLLLGRLVPAALHIEQPHVWLARTKDDVLLFGGMAAQGNAGGNSKDTLKNIADDLTHARFTRKLEISDATVTIHDETSNGDWAVTMPETRLERHLGGTLSGESKIEVAQGGRVALLVAHYDYAPFKERHNLTMRVSGINPKLFAGAGSKVAIVDVPFTGEISFAFDKALALESATLDMHGEAGTLDYPDFWDAPRAVKSLDIKASYDRASGTLDVPQANIDFGGPKLAMTLTGAPPDKQTSPPHDLDFTLLVKLADLPMNDFAKIWPKPVIADARAWMAANLSKGTYDRGEASFKGALAWNDLSNLEIREGQGKISASGASVKYLDGMPPVTGVNAAANFDLNQMTIAISGGGIGDLRLQPSTIALADFEKDMQNIDLPVHVVGPVPAVLKLIDKPPLGYAKAVGLDPNSVTGNFDGTLKLKFPLLAALLMKNIDVKANANLTDLASSKLVPGLDITQGELAMALDKTGFTLQGTAALDKVPLNVAWQQTFNEASGKPLQQATITGTISGNQWKDLGVNVLAATEGPVSITLHMLQKTKKSTSLAGALDMKAAAMQVAELNWKKPAGDAATLTFDAEMPAGKNITVKSIVADGTGLKIKGSAVLAADSLAPLAVNLDSLIVGRTNAKLRFTQAPGPTGKLSFSAEGASFDVSGLRNGKDPERTDPRPKEYRLKLGKLYTSDDGFLNGAFGSAVRDPQGWSAMSLHGLADGGHQLDIDLAPQADGHRVLTVTCDDFGKALKSLGITDTVKGGKFDVRGESTAAQPRLIEGKIKIGSFEVKNLPALVVLMNATSPFGLINLFNGSLDFDRLAGKFRWHGDRLEFDGIHAAGNSVGMTIDGKLDMDSGATDLYGTMAPFSLFNRIIGAIPLIGDVLTGGEGQGVLGVTYTVKGQINKPDVSVNPVSLFTPGFLRNLFFGGGDNSDDTEAGGTPPSKAPAPAAEKNLPPAKTNINK